MSNKQCDVDKNDVSLIKALASPPRLVKEELSATALLLGLPEHQTKEWRYIKQMIGDVMFLKMLKEVDATKISKETATKARHMLADVTGDQVKQVSQACHGFHLWNQRTIQTVLGSADTS